MMLHALPRSPRHGPRRGGGCTTTGGFFLLALFFSALAAANFGLFPSAYAEITDACHDLQKVMRIAGEPSQATADQYCALDCEFNEAITCDGAHATRILDTCANLRQITDSHGEFNPTTRNLYCSLGCDYNQLLKCGKPEREGVPAYWQRLVDAAARHVANVTAFDPESAHDQLAEPLENLVAVDKLIGYAYHYIPVALIGLVGLSLAFIPVRDSAWAWAFGVVSVLYMFAYHTLAVALPGLMAILGLLVSPHHSDLHQVSVLTAFGLITLSWVAVMFSAVGAVQVSVAVLIILGLGSVLYKLYRSNRGVDGVIVFHVLAQFTMMGPLVLEYIGAVGATNGVLQLLVTFTRVLAPYGRDKFMIINHWRTVTQFVLYIRRYGITVDARGFYLAYIAAIIITIAVRAIVGWLVITRTTRVFDLKHFWIGLLIYCDDVFRSPFGAVYDVYSLVAGSKRNVMRSLLYNALMTVLLYNEYHHARDVVVIRCAVWFLDWAVIRTDYRAAARLLSSDIVFTTGFPQKGSLPWFDLEAMSAIQQATRRIVCAGRSGVGLLRKFSRGNAIVTAAHVVAGNPAQLAFGGAIVDAPDVAVADVDHVDSVASFPADLGGAVELSNMCQGDISVCRALAVVHPDAAIALITDFKFNLNDGEVIASVNLRSGDSGAPVIAVLNDGSMRYAGAVSRGAFDTGHGNIISSVLNRIFNGSPGPTPPPLVDAEVVAPDPELTVDFNKAIKMFEVAHVTRDLAKCLADGQAAAKAKGKNKERYQARARKRLTDLLAGSDLAPATAAELLAAYDKLDIVAFNAARSRVEAATRAH